MDIFEVSKTRNIKFVQNYINSDNNINVVNEKNRICLYLACVNNNIEIIKLLL